MGLSYQPKAITLSFKEGKPVTYKAQQVTYPTIKSKDLLAYAANAANVPLANIECCVQGLIEAINYFVLNGHAVQLEGLGSFSPRINSKTTQNPDEVGAELITHDSEALQYCDAPNATPEEAGWNWVPYDLDLGEAWGTKEVTVTDHRIPNPDGEGTIVDYQIITSGEGELKMTTPPEQGGTLSPMPFAYVAPVED